MPRSAIIAESVPSMDGDSSLALDQFCAVVVGVVFALINGGGLGLKWLPAHLDVNLFELGREGIADVARNRLLFQQCGFDVFHGFLHSLRLPARVLSDLFPQLDEETLLIF